MQNKLYYNNLPIQKIREFGMGGNLKAEITIVVPRKYITEDIVEQQPIKDSELATTIASEDMTDNDNGNQEDVLNPQGVYAISKEQEIYLGSDRDSEEFAKLCKDNKLNPDQVKSALDGNIKTHKGYSFEIK